jgi:hypothetical protein
VEGPPWLIFLICAGVGALSAVLGLGGGVLLVPIFTLLFNLPIHQAIALSLCCVMATSVTATIRYLPDGLIDLRPVLILETTTIVGSYGAAVAAGMIAERVIAVIFACVMIFAALMMLVRKSGNTRTERAHRHAYPLALGVSFIAGGLVGLLGIGGGVIKVPLLRLVMGMSMKEAVAASAMMVGISAAFALVPYLQRSDIPVNFLAYAALGTITGAFISSRLFHRIESIYIKIVFALVLIYTAANLVIRAWQGN